MVCHAGVEPQWRQIVVASEISIPAGHERPAEAIAERALTDDGTRGLCVAVRGLRVGFFSAPSAGNVANDGLPRGPLRACMNAPKVHSMMNRARLMTVYGVDAKGGKSFKDINDPRHMCETSASPPMLPWETAHVVEWRIENLAVSRKGAPCMYGGIPIRPGKAITSPPFRAAGVCGSLRFWPAGFYSEPQRRAKARRGSVMAQIAFARASLFCTQVLPRREEGVGG